MANPTKKETPVTACTILFCVIYTISLICWGGFGEVMILLGAVSSLFFILFKKNQIRISLNQGVFLIFSLWYLFCSLQNGFFIEPLIRGLLPFVVFLFWLIISNTDGLKKKAISILLEVSLWVAVIAVFHCIVTSVSASSLRRLTFPFDYSNACGIFFAVLYFLAGREKSRFLRNGRYVFLAALLLSQSVGAIALFCMASVFELIKNKKYALLVCGAVFFAVGSFVLRGRIAESMGTFLERLLQIYDGIRCIAAHPVTGTGAFWWEFAKQHYQTGFYEAKTLHSGFVAIGVNSGVVGLVLFSVVCVGELRKLFAKKGYFIPAVMILVHSLVDFSLSFFVIPVLLLLSLPESDDEKTFSVSVFLQKGICAVLACGMVISLGGSFLAARFQNNIAKGLPPAKAQEVFNESFFLKSSVRSAQSVSALLYTESKDGDGLSLKKYKYMPVEMMLLNSVGKEGGEEYLLNCLRVQPYNTALKAFVADKCSGECIEKAYEITRGAVVKASVLGKKLYKLKGENK